MKRRFVLTLLGSCIAVAGCAHTETGTPDTTAAGEPAHGPTESSETPDHAEDIFVVLQNETPEQVTVAVTITRGDSVSFEDEATVNPGETQYVYPGITERGEYELTVSLPDRPVQTRPFDVEDYDLRMGSNIDVWISTDTVRIGIEE